MLRRCGGTGDHPLRLWVLCQCVDEKTELLLSSEGRTFSNPPCLPERDNVPTNEYRARRRQWQTSPRWDIHGGSGEPEIRVLMQYPTPRSVIHLCHVASRLHQVGDHLEKWLGAFREIGDLSRPIIHFQVDVGCPFAAHGGMVFIVPDPLKVGRLAAGAGSSTSRVTTKLEVKGHEPRIVRLFELLQPLVGREHGRL